MNDTPITRRSALTTGTLFLGAGLMAAAGTRPAPVAAAPSDDIDHAEALLLELLRLLPVLEDRDRSNAGRVLEIMGDAAGMVEPGFSDGLAIAAEHIGPGKRVMDRVDQQEAAEKRASVTHAAVVAQYAAAYHAGGTNAGTEIRAELASAYGEELGDAIAGAAFDLYLHELYHDGAA